MSLDTALYVALGVTTFLLSQHLPYAAILVIGSINAGLIAWKAKRSQGANAGGAANPTDK